MYKKIILTCTLVAFVILFGGKLVPQSYSYQGLLGAPEPEANLIIVNRIFDGGGLYSSFSILYPPGRFIWQAFLFALLGASVNTQNLGFGFFNLFLFAISFFSLIYLVFRNLLQGKLSDRSNFFVSYFAGLAGVFLHWGLNNTSQEAHVFASALFILGLTKFKNQKLKILLLGFIFGLISVFRMDAAIIVAIAFIAGALALHDLSLFKRGRTTKWEGVIKFLCATLGFFAVWLPIIIYTFFNGSLTKMFYDIFVLGLIVHPQVMDLPLPVHELKYVFWFALILLTGGGVAMFKSAMQNTNKEKAFYLGSFSIFAVLSYVSALGHSDYAHLLYGTVFLPPLLLYCILSLPLSKRVGRASHFANALGGGYSNWLKLFINFILCSALLCAFAFLVLHTKSPKVFLFTAPGFIIVVSKYFKFTVTTVAKATLVVALLIFHSLSFLKLNFNIPTLGLIKVPNLQYFKPVNNTFGLAKIGEAEQKILKQISADIPHKDKYLFIFPNNVIIGELLGKTNPTRYVILAYERSDFTDSEILSDLKKTNTKYFLVFPKQAHDVRGKIWQYILQNTNVYKKYKIGGQDVELRRLNSPL